MTRRIRGSELKAGPLKVLTLMSRPQVNILKPRSFMDRGVSLYSNLGETPPRDPQAHSLRAVFMRSERL